LKFLPVTSQVDVSSFSTLGSYVTKIM